MNTDHHISEMVTKPTPRDVLRKHVDTS